MYDTDPSFHDVMKDNTSGSNQLVDKLMNATINYVSKENASKNGILKALQSIVERHQQLAVIYDFADQMVDFVKTQEKFDPEGLIEMIEKYKSRYDNSISDLAKKLQMTIGTMATSCMLISQSGTIINLLSRLKDYLKNMKITQLESRPAQEGIIQAQRLADVGFKVELIVDSAFYSKISDVDFVMVGTDAVLEDRFINKIGTRALAEACKLYHIPFYVVTDTRKMVGKLKHFSTKPLLTFRENDPAEVWNSVHPKIRISNPYFESIPNPLVSGFITN